MTRTALASIAILATAAMAAPAAASSFSFVVKDHELSSYEGAQSVYNRIEFKAKKTCQSGVRRPLYALRVERECIADMTAEIVASIGHPRLTQVHAAAQDDDARYAAR